VRAQPIPTDGVGTVVPPPVLPSQIFLAVHDPGTSGQLGATPGELRGGQPDAALVLLEQAAGGSVPHFVTIIGYDNSGVSALANGNVLLLIAPATPQKIKPGML
jgi:hypothetical protein